MIFQGPHFLTNLSFFFPSLENSILKIPDFYMFFMTVGTPILVVVPHGKCPNHFLLNKLHLCPHIALLFLLLLLLTLPSNKVKHTSESEVFFQILLYHY